MAPEAKVKFKVTVAMKALWKTKDMNKQTQKQKLVYMQGVTGPKGPLPVIVYI